MLLLETQYLPSIAWCSAIWQQELVAMDAVEHYQKGSLRNRCHIAGPNGPQRLSIPLEKGKHQQTAIREVRISYEIPWQRQHWRSIMTAYGSAPYFEHYGEEIRRFYEQKWVFLFDYNLDFLEFILKKKMGWQGAFTQESRYCPTGQWTQGPDIRGDIGGGIGDCPKWFAPKRYPQVFEDRTGFLPNLSVLDLLFCCGKNGRDVLAQHLFLPN